MGHRTSGEVSFGTVWGGNGAAGRLAWGRAARETELNPLPEPRWRSGPRLAGLLTPAWARPGRAADGSLRVPLPFRDENARHCGSLVLALVGVSVRALAPGVVTKKGVLLPLTCGLGLPATSARSEAPSCPKAEGL